MISLQELILDMEGADGDCMNVARGFRVSEVVSLQMPIQAEPRILAKIDRPASRGSSASRPPIRTIHKLVLPDRAANPAMERDGDAKGMPPIGHWARIPHTNMSLQSQCFWFHDWVLFSLFVTSEDVMIRAHGGWVGSYP